MSLRQKTIIKVYEEYIKGKNNKRDKYLAYQVIQRLHKMSDQKFKVEFDANNKREVEQFVAFIGGTNVTSLNHLRLKTIVAKNIDQSNIYLEFSNNFKLENINDKIIGTMLKNVDKRI